jgi:hypothetical protein
LITEIALIRTLYITAELHLRSRVNSWSQYGDSETALHHYITTRPQHKFERRSKSCCQQEIARRQPWSGTPSLQRSELLAKSQILKKQGALSAEHPQNRSKQKPNHIHHVTVLQHPRCEREGRILLKSQQNRVLASNRPTPLLTAP